MKKIFTVISILVALLYGCSTDFDVIAPYKEIMVVDGLLNAIDSIQYVKISKAYLGEGNAYVMAQVSDSINYANILDVKMDRIHNGAVVETFNLDRLDTNKKVPGTFANPGQVFYTTSHPILQDGSEYKINVTNTETGVVATSQTKIVKDVIVLTPSPSPNNPNRDSVDFATFGGESPVTVRFNPGENSRIFDVIVRFRYREIDPIGVSSEKFVEWTLSDQNYAVPPSEITFKFIKNDFYQNVGAQVPDKPGYIRRIDLLENNLRPVEYVIVEGTENLQTYYQLHQPTTGIVQELPTFTTVQNGLGLFTSRLVRTLHYCPNEVTQAAFDTSKYTKTKNFQFD